MGCLFLTLCLLGDVFPGLPLPRNPLEIRRNPVTATTTGTKNPAGLRRRGGEQRPESVAAHAIAFLLEAEIHLTM